jgi:aryl-alcohol dehydrogenase-like predicted oxidoreductase
METRLFGRTGHWSTVAIFGAAALSEVDQAEADRAMELLFEYGVNHIDVAPSYGDAENRIGPWMARDRDRFFVGCKTMERSKEGALKELHESLGRLQMERFDLYQIHAITSMEELDEATRSGGALEGIIEARDAGLTRFVGITGHGVDTPTIFLEALRRYDFDSVLFPLNFVQYANPAYRTAAQELIQVCQERQVGTMTIKSITKRPWGEQEQVFDTWYEPFTDADRIQAAVNFVLSQPITGLCTAGDTRLLPKVLAACEDYVALSEAEQEALIASAGAFEPLFS